jgi:chromosome segregation ATPase
VTNHNTTVYKKKLATAEEKEASLKNEISNLQAQVETFTSQGNEIQTHDAEDLINLRDQIATLTQEKVALETALNETKAAAPGPGEDVVALQSTIVRYFPT